MSALVLMNLLNKLGKRDKMQSLLILLLVTSLINSKIQAYMC